MNRRSSMVTGCLLLCAAFASSTLAQDVRETARVQFERGIGLYEAHDYSGALESFQDAYRLAPHPSVRVNMANCYEHLHRPIEALHHYERFLAQSSDAPRQQRREVEAAIARMRALVGEVRLAIAPDGATVVIDGSETRRAPVLEPVMMMAGTHTVTVRMDEYVTATEEVVVVEGGMQLVGIQLERADTPAPSAGPAPSSDPPPASRAWTTGSSEPGTRAGIILVSSEPDDGTLAGARGTLMGRGYMVAPDAAIQGARHFMGGSADDVSDEAMVRLRGALRLDLLIRVRIALGEGEERYIALSQFAGASPATSFLSADRSLVAEAVIEALANLPPPNAPSAAPPSVAITDASPPTPPAAILETQTVVPAQVPSPPEVSPAPAPVARAPSEPAPADSGVLRVLNSGNAPLCTVEFTPLGADGDPANSSDWRRLPDEVSRIESGASMSTELPAGRWRISMKTCGGSSVFSEDLVMQRGGERSIEADFHVRHSFRFSVSGEFVAHVFTVPGGTNVGGIAMGTYMTAAVPFSESGWGLGITGWFTSRGMLDDNYIGFLGGMLFGVTRGPGMALGVGWMSFTEDHFGFALGVHGPFVTLGDFIGISLTGLVGVSMFGSQAVFYSQAGLGFDVHY